MTESVAEGVAPADTVELHVPADPAYVSVLRTVAASLAAQRDFTIDEIDDLRIAVDEASALLLPHVGTGGCLSAVFGGAADNLRVTVSVPLPDGEPEPRPSLDQSSFGWMVLAALADTVGTELSGGRLLVTLTKTRGARS